MSISPKLAVYHDPFRHGMLLSFDFGNKEIVEEENVRGCCKEPHTPVE